MLFIYLTKTPAVLYRTIDVSIITKYSIYLQGNIDSKQGHQIYGRSNISSSRRRLQGTRTETTSYTRDSKIQKPHQSGDINLPHSPSIGQATEIHLRSPTDRPTVYRNHSIKSITKITNIKRTPPPLGMELLLL